MVETPISKGKPCVGAACAQSKPVYWFESAMVNWEINYGELKYGRSFLEYTAHPFPAGLEPRYADIGKKSFMPVKTPECTTDIIFKDIFLWHKQTSS
ncbi:MAG: hypothetical protein INR73_26030 [Williamsia sp.]|nr:hypothetical protein [Williamsia sp.]